MNLQPARSSLDRSLPVSATFMRVAMPAFMAAMMSVVHAESQPEKPEEAPAKEQVEAPVVITPAEPEPPKPEVKEAVKAPAEIIVTKFTPLPEGWSRLKTTSVSQMFRDIERKVNATNPEFPVVILDDDSINLRPTNNDPTFRNRFYEVLNDRGIQLRWNTRSDILEALGNLKGPSRREAVAKRVDRDTYASSHNPLDMDVMQSKVCLVIPAVADWSSRSEIERWLGRAGSNFQEAKADPGPYAMMLRATWHEVWHCIDRTYYRDQYRIVGDSAINNSHRMHMSEVFADVAATLTMASLGYTNIVRDMADVRAVNSRWNGKISVRGSRSTDEAYYEGVTYYLTRAHDLVAKHIQDVGQETISRYSLEDIRRIAIEITEQGALNKEEFKLLADYNLQGDALLTALRGQNGSGAAKLQFLNGIIEREKVARQRLLTDTGRPVVRIPRPEDNDHYGAVDILADMPQTEKDEVSNIIGERTAAAKAEGKRPEQGIIDLMDEWRREVHNATERKPDIERKLYVLSLMLAYGQLEDKVDFKRKVRGKLLEPEKKPDQPAEVKPGEPDKPKTEEVTKPADKAEPKAAPEEKRAADKPQPKEEPKPFIMPKFPELPPGKWEPVPEGHNQARINYQFKLA